MNAAYSDAAPKRAEVDALKDATLLEFGSPGRRLGRSFGVKLWPTLVFLSDGKKVARLVRPRDAQAIAQALEKIDGSTRQ